MDMNWMTPQEASKIWGINVRQVQSLCAQEKVKGATKLGRVWLIPKGSSKPIDGRIKTVERGETSS